MKKLILIGVVLLLVVVGAGVGYQIWNERVSPSVNNDPIELVYWGVYEPVENIQPLIDEFQTQNPGITIKYVRKNLNNYRQQIENTSGTAAGPDMYRFHNSWIRTLRKVNDVTPSFITNAIDYEQDFYPVVASDLQTGMGGYYGLPLMYDGLALYYNRKIFREAGITTVPKEWTDIFGAQGVASNLARPGVDIAVIGMGSSKNVDHWQDLFSFLMLQVGANLAQPNLTLEETESATNFFKKPISDKLWAETNPRTTEMFAQGKLAMMFGTSWSAFEVQALNPQLDFAVTPMPQLPGIKIGYASYWIEGVSARISSRKKEAAWKFLLYLHNQDVVKRRYGIQEASRLFGEPYARRDLASTLSQNRYVAGILETAAQAQSWYMADKTISGGFNEEITKAYSDYISGTITLQILETRVQDALRKAQ